jgi:3-deoxy-manno-octulosonate cytidylyltransferase (CMP-KDO synthetase)
MMKSIAIIPARMGSSRFPGKPMALISGKPMIGHVHDNVKKCKLLEFVVVATCDKIIFDYINKIGGIAVMTSKKHQRATDRCAEALNKIETKFKKKFDIVVMVQGDEPMVTSKMIAESIKPFSKDNKIGVVNLLSKFENYNEFLNPNTIKVVCDKNFDAVYFTRKLDNKYFFDKSLKCGKQVCIIPFKREFLEIFLKLKSTPLEKLESIDMLRFLEHGYKVRMKKILSLSFAVDNKKDLKKVSKYINKKK